MILAFWRVLTLRRLFSNPQISVYSKMGFHWIIFTTFEVHCRTTITTATGWDMISSDRPHLSVGYQLQSVHSIFWLRKTKRISRGWRGNNKSWRSTPDDRSLEDVKWKPISSFRLEADLLQIYKHFIWKERRCTQFVLEFEHHPSSLLHIPLCPLCFHLLLF